MVEVLSIQNGLISGWALCRVLFYFCQKACLHNQKQLSHCLVFNNILLAFLHRTICKKYNQQQDWFKPDIRSLTNFWSKGKV